MDMVRLSDIRLSGLGLAAAAVLIMAAGCAKDNMIGGEENPIRDGGNHAWIERVYASIGEEINSQEPDSKTSINQTLDNSGLTDMPATKTSIDQTLNPMIRWSAGDEISVFASSVNEEYSYIGEDGSASGSFEHKSGTTGMLTYNSIYAVYPYSASNSISDEGLVIEFPTTQTYAANSFGPGAAPMVAVCAASDEPSFNFKPLCGYLKLKLWNSEGKSVRSIALTANGSSKIAGNATVVYNGTSEPTVTMASDATSKVVLDCGTDGVTLGTSASAATVFWITLPPVTMNTGFTVTVTATDGTAIQKATTPSRTITRNTINSMAAFECNFAVPIPEAVDLGLSVKWASCNLGASFPEEYGDYYAWGEIETKDTYDCSTYKWMADGQSSWQYINKYTWPDGRTTASWYDSDGTFIGDSLKVLQPEDDVVHVKLGGNWRMPTKSELQELYDDCTWTSTHYYAKRGYKVQSNKDGYTDKWIFLPVAGYMYNSRRYNAGSYGYYWSSSLYPGNSYCAYALYFDPSNVHPGDYYNRYRYYGYSVRPVTE